MRISKVNSVLYKIIPCTVITQYIGILTPKSNALQKGHSLSLGLPKNLAHPTPLGPSELVCSLPQKVPVHATARCTMSQRHQRCWRGLNSDVVVVSDVASKRLEFNPPCNYIAQALCTQMKEESEKVDMVSTNVGGLGAQCTNDKIVADGNC